MIEKSEQPVKGDIILTCGHYSLYETAMWIKLNAWIEFTRLDGSVGKSKFVALCIDCFYAWDGNFNKLPISHDFAFDNVGILLYSDPMDA